MNKTEFVAAISAKLGDKVTKKDVEALVGAYAEVVTATLKKGDKVQLIGFGTFEARKRAARVGKNPQTGEALKIAASTVPAFKPGKAFKEALNKKKK
jgi:DNA-binding protein HU-beta